MPEEQWPPAKRCGNCGWWVVKEGVGGWIYELIQMPNRLGQCRHPREGGDTWHSHTCSYHTDKGKDEA